MSTVPLLYYRAARKGHVGAQQALGYKYFFGLGVKKNCVAAAQYYMGAAKRVKEEVEQGTSKSAHRIWLDRLFYISSNKDEEFVSLERFLIFEDDVLRGGKGWAKHYATLGTYYYEGLFPVEKDYFKAAEYFKEHLAHYPNTTNSLYHLGVIYKEGGNGMKRNYGEALMYFKMAQDLGDFRSVNKIGEMFYEGKGVPKQERKAWDLFKGKIDVDNSGCE